MATLWNIGHEQIVVLLLDCTELLVEIPETPQDKPMLWVDASAWGQQAAWVIATGRRDGCGRAIYCEERTH